MVRKINGRGMIVLAAALLGLVLGASEVQSADWLNLRQKISARNIRFEKEVRDMTVLQEVKTATLQGEVASEIKMFKKGKKLRIETVLPSSGIPEGMGGMKTIIIFDGKDSWIISPFMGKQKIPDSEEEQSRQVNWSGWLPKKAKVIGVEKIGKRKCYMIETEGKEKVVFTRTWIDQKSLNLIKAENKSPGVETTVYLFSDFRKVKGNLEMAYRTEIYRNDELMSTSRTKSLKINTGPSDKLFNPDEVKVEGSNAQMQEMIRKAMEQRK